MAAKAAEIGKRPPTYRRGIEEQFAQESVGVSDGPGAVQKPDRHVGKQCQGTEADTRGPVEEAECGGDLPVETGNDHEPNQEDHFFGNATEITSSRKSRDVAAL